MSICYANHIEPQWPVEQRLLQEVSVRLLKSSERKRFDQLLQKEHYLHNPNSVGQVLRYVAEYQGEWVGILTFCSSALHLKPRDQFLHWSARQVRQRRHLIAQNSRFLILPSTGRWPNLASRILKLTCQRLPDDWQEAFGHPVLLAETFVDPQRFRGTCYRAAGWQLLGKTQGFKRNGQDFYLDTQHPKQLWLRPLCRKALKQLRAEQLPPELQTHQLPLPPEVPVTTKQMDSLWDFVRGHLPDPRECRGIRYPIGTLVSLTTLAIGAGCTGPHAIWKFVRSLNHGQRRRLRCPRTKDCLNQYDVPCERTFTRFLNAVDPDSLSKVFCQWMAHLNPEPPTLLHFDGKVLKNTEPAPPKLEEDQALEEASARIETPKSEQKPTANKALTLVNFQTPEQQLIDQIAVPSDTNEEAAVAAHLPKMDLTGVIAIGDAAHTVKANCLNLSQLLGADYLFFLKGNQPNAFAKAKTLLRGDFPPSDPNL